MIRFTVTRTMFEGDTYITQVELESQGLFDAWIVEKSELIGEVYSVTSENIDSALEKQARLDLFKEKVNANKTKKTCDEIHAYLSQLNLEKEFTSIQLDTIQADSEVISIFQALKDGRPEKVATLIGAYEDETYYSATEKQTIIDFITDSLT